MSGRLMTMLTVGVGLAAVACSDRREQLPAAPNYHPIADELSGCDFGHLRMLLGYFDAVAGRKAAVGGLLNGMQSAGPFTTTARDRAFDMMVRIDSAVATNTAGAPATGSDFVNHLILCMYNPSVPAGLASFPVTFPEDFTVALTPVSGMMGHGAFSVRGGGSDPASSPVLSRPVTAPFSGVAPPTGLNWSMILPVASNPAPKRVLLYGRPGSTSSQHYDWNVVPHNAVFNPGAIVGLCIDADAVANATSMVQEENVGALSFVDAGFLVPGVCSPVAFVGDGWGPLKLASRLAELGSTLFSPAPLWAATGMNPGGLGGSAGGIRSEFGPLDLTATAGGVTLTVIQQPLATVKVNTQFTVKVRATSGATAVGGVSITLESFNNNGAKVVLSGANPVVTGEDGVATFTLSLNKPGAYRLRTTSLTSVLGRPAIAVAGTETQKFNVKPK